VFLFYLIWCWLDSLIQLFFLSSIEAELGAGLHPEHRSVVNCEELLNNLGFGHKFSPYLAFKRLNLICDSCHDLFHQVINSLLLCWEEVHDVEWFLIWQFLFIKEYLEECQSHRCVNIAVEVFPALGRNVIKYLWQQAFNDLIDFLGYCRSCIGNIIILLLNRSVRGPSWCLGWCQQVPTLEQALEPPFLIHIHEFVNGSVQDLTIMLTTIA